MNYTGSYYHTLRKVVSYHKIGQYLFCQKMSFIIDNPNTFQHLRTKDQNGPLTYSNLHMIKRVSLNRYIAQWPFVIWLNESAFDLQPQ